MKISRTKITLCLFIFCIGLYAGSLLYIPFSAGLSVSDKISCIAGLSTIFISLLALEQWKHQFQHTERFKAITNLEMAFRNSLELFAKYKLSYHSKAIQGMSQTEILDQEEHKTFQGAHFGYMKTWSYACSFLTEKEEGKYAFNPDALFRKLHDTTK